jgi:phosphatidylserine decarboxylase
MEDGLTKTINDLKRTITQTVFIAPHRAGYPFIAGFAVVTAFLAMLSTFLGFAGLVLTLWCVYFFRDPQRAVPQRDGLIIAPADGRITQIAEAVPLPKELRSNDEVLSDDDEGDFTRISIFLSVFDVHIQRNPLTGLVKRVVYKPGIFLNAGNDLASMENERCAALIARPDGQQLAVVQIAGLIARRIICDLQEGQDVKSGERYGLIRFGSRVDIYLPKGVAPQVCVGQRTIGGETILADLTSREPARDAILV